MFWLQGTANQKRDSLQGMELNGMVTEGHQDLLQDTKGFFWTTNHAKLLQTKMKTYGTGG